MEFATSTEVCKLLSLADMGVQILRRSSTFCVGIYVSIPVLLGRVSK